MSEYRIVCIVMDKDENRIEKVGLIEPGENKSYSKRVVARKRVNELIKEGHRVFYVLEGQKTNVHSFDDEFIRTDRDDIPHNNLGGLRKCRI